MKNKSKSIETEYTMLKVKLSYLQKNYESLLLKYDNLKEEYKYIHDQLKSESKGGIQDLVSPDSNEIEETIINSKEDMKKILIELKNIYNDL